MSNIWGRGKKTTFFVYPEGPLQKRQPVSLEEFEITLAFEIKKVS